MVLIEWILFTIHRVFHRMVLKNVDARVHCFCVLCFYCTNSNSNFSFHLRFEWSINSSVYYVQFFILMIAFRIFVTVSSILLRHIWEVYRNEFRNWTGHRLTDYKFHLFMLWRFPDHLTCDTEGEPSTKKIYFRKALQVYSWSKFYNLSISLEDLNIFSELLPSSFNA